MNVICCYFIATNALYNTSAKYFSFSWRIVYYSFLQVTIISYGNSSAPKDRESTKNLLISSRRRGNERMSNLRCQYS